MPTPRYASRVSTRTTGAQVSAANDNAVEDRILQLSEDIGGPPSDMDTVDQTSLVDGINELVAKGINLALPRSVHGVEFHALGGLREDDRLATVTGGVSNLDGATGLPVGVGVYLPHGVALSQLKVYAHLAHAAASVEVVLQRLKLSDATSTDLGTVTLTGSTGDLSGTASFSSTVNNTDYVYALKATLTNDSIFSEAVLRGVVLS